MRKNSYKKKIILILLSGIIMVLLWWLNYLDFKNKFNPEISLYLHQSQKVIKLDFEEYLIGTVAAEMPASFDIEALKAQAVCARTYAYKKIIEQHPYPRGANLTDDINNCQAYMSWQEFKEAHPYNARKYYDKIKKAVKATEGLIMVFDGKPIDALYHSTCGGRTEDSLYAWGNAVPYLRSVKCEYCANSSYYQKEYIITGNDLKSKLNEKLNRINLKIMERSPSGRVKKIKINDQVISGEKFRFLFDLPSTCFYIEAEDSCFKVKTHGYGHGVGMCQFGSHGLALQGKNFNEILNYYYQDIELYKLAY